MIQEVTTGAVCNDGKEIHKMTSNPLQRVPFYGDIHVMLLILRI